MGLFDLFKEKTPPIYNQSEPENVKTAENEIANQNISESALLPEVLQNMSFKIILKEGCSLFDGCFLEHFWLYKNANDVIKIDWSVGFGYSIGSHNPGAGGDDVVPSEFFLNNDLSAFATYISDKYKEVVSYDDIYYNDEVKTLFDLCVDDG